MAHTTRAALYGAALLALSACGSAGGQGGLLSIAGTLIPGKGGGAGLRDAAAARPGYTPQDIAANLDGFIFVTVPTMGPTIPARRIADNAGHQTWDAQVGFTVSFRDGIMVATRGLGDDLMGADAPGLRAALEAGGGAVVRRHDYLDGQDQVVTESYDCTVTAEGVEEIDLGLSKMMAARFAEDCGNAAVIFENLYWLDTAGNVVSSRQYVSRTVAYLRANRL